MSTDAGVRRHGYEGTFRVAVVGVGDHATSVLIPLIREAGFDIVATCARRRSSADAAAAKFRIAAAYDSVPEMLEGTSPDAVIAAVPPAAYSEVVRACIERGVPVLAEKPGAVDAHEAEELADLSLARGVPVMVGYMKRFAPAYRQARAVIEDAAFGSASLATFVFVMGDFETDFRNYLIDNTVHHLDLARFLLGELGEVHARRRPSFGGRHAVAVMATSESGALVSFQFGSTGSWFQRNEWVEIVGEGASVNVDNVDTCVYRPGSRPEQVWRPNYSIPLEGNLTSTTLGFLPELLHFRDVVAGSAVCESSLESASRTLLLLRQVEKVLALT